MFAKNGIFILFFRICITIRFVPDRQRSGRVCCFCSEVEHCLPLQDPLVVIAEAQLCAGEARLQRMQPWPTTRHSCRCLCSVSDAVDCDMWEAAGTTCTGCGCVPRVLLLAFPEVTLCVPGVTARRLGRPLRVRWSVAELAGWLRTGEARTGHAGWLCLCFVLPLHGRPRRRLEPPMSRVDASRKGARSVRVYQSASMPKSFEQVSD